ncbi:neuronal pentraxin-1-like [Ambystoma mexicanum]|uniref:neuronal pentraxin-1-like n=1 Tax=Ambystoma mexicanum TaxID=8296 RepID=UPI0037E8E599
MSVPRAPGMALFRILTHLCLFLVPCCLGEYAHTKFVCTPMPLDMESICQTASARHSSGSSGHWVGSHEEAKETILHLREAVVQQKETILDQRETIRELTAKLTRCEGSSRGKGHEDTHGHTAENSQDRDHGHEESHGGHEREHGGHERVRGYEEILGHSREHGHEREHGAHEREHSHEWDHGQEREHGAVISHVHEREYTPEWEHGHEREHGGHDRDHGYEEIHGHSRDYDYHPFGHRDPREHQQTQQYRRSSQTQNTMGDPPKEASLDPLQMEKMVESLKERLEHLQVSRNNSMFSSSLRESLQRKISLLEHQMSMVNATEQHNREDQLRQDLPIHTLEADTTDKGVKAAKASDGFRIGFPMRSDYLFVKVKRTIYRELFAFTISLWLKTSSSPGMGTPFSYAVPGQANELVLIEWGNNPMELLINDKAATLPLAINDAKWHHICITWSTRDGIWESYQDGVRKGSGENLAPWHPIKPGGVFILGQEQDTLGGRFDATQAFVGEMSDFNMWSHILTPSEIFELATCASQSTGDIIEWTEPSMELHGGAAKMPLNACH